MNTRHLEEFIELGKQLNFSSAAREMYVSQPTLSQHIAMMEEEMGFQLVTREGSVELTPEGAEFFSMAQDVVNRCETARTRCRNLSQGGPKTVRVPDILSTFPVGRMLDQVVGDLYAQDPVSQVIVRKVDYGRHDPMSLLDEDLVDVGFDFSCCGSEHVAQRYRERGYRAFRLLKVPMLVAVPRGHRLESERLLARSLDGETFLSRSNPFCRFVPAGHRGHVRFGGGGPSSEDGLRLLVLRSAPARVGGHGVCRQRPITSRYTS